MTEEEQKIPKQEIDWLNVPDGFEFCIIETDDEVEELITFNALVHEPDAGDLLKRLLDYLPGFGRDMNYVIRDKEVDTIVACINSIPNTWSYEGIQLRNLELGFVGTSEAYRNKGLVNTLYSYFDRLLVDGNYDVSAIQGIPYFYRKYGYDFILPLMRSIMLPVGNIPPITSEEEPAILDIAVRPANQSDLKCIMELYQEENQKLLVSSVRDQGLWEVQEQLKMNDSQSFETMILENNGKCDGYFRVGIRKNDENKSSTIVADEGSIRSYDSVMRTLHYLRDKANEQNALTVQLSGNVCSNLEKTALDYGGALSPGWKYQIRIPDMLRFLNKIRPILEERLRGTMFEGMTRELHVNTYRSCYKLTFVNGNLKPIEDIGMQKMGTHMGIRLPPLGFVRLVLGEYTVDELKNQNIDFIVRRGQKILLETLFPKKESYIYPYFC